MPLEMENDGTVSCSIGKNINHELWMEKKRRKLKIYGSVKLAKKY